MLPKKRKSGGEGAISRSTAATAVDIPKHATLRRETVRCGRCPKAHGPYWYAYFREAREDGGRLRKRYIGRVLPASMRTRLRRQRTLARRKGAPNIPRAPQPRRAERPRNDKRGVSRAEARGKTDKGTTRRRKRSMKSVYYSPS